MSNLADASNAVESLPPELSRDYLAHHGLCPKSITADGALVIAATQASIVDGAADIAFAFRRSFAIEVVPRPELEALIERLATRADRTVELARIDSGSESDTADTLATDVRDLANQPPVIRYVNLLVRDAYDASASDIHLEATRTGLSARFRLDGVLTPAPEPPSHLHHAVVSRIKLLAELDIAERRRPQDGRIRVRLESRELDLRVSTVPTMYGESVVLRLLDHGGRPVALDALGMAPDVWAAMRDLDAASVFANGPIDRDAIDAALANRGANANSPARTLAERGELVAVLENAAWDTRRAASELGVHRATLYRRMKRHGITIPTWPACRADSSPRRDAPRTPARPS